MTDNGYMSIIKRINEMQIQPPEGMNIYRLEAWLLGASKMHHDILAIIEEIGRGQRE